MLNSDNEWITEETTIKQLVSHHFHQLFHSELIMPMELHTTHCFPMIMPEDMLHLESPFSLEETKKALFAMGNF